MKVLVGQSTPVTLYVDERLKAVPTAATVAFRGAGEQAFVDAIAATVDEADIAVSAASAPGESSLTFAATPSLTAGRRYLLVIDGRAVTVQVEGVVGNDAVLADPLIGGAPVGARLIGQAVAFTFPAARASVPGDALVRVTATVAGAPRIWTQAITVQRNIAPIPITAQDLIETHPRARDLREAADTTLTSAIAGGWEVLLHELRRRGYHEDRIRSSSELALPCKTAVMYALIRGANPGDTETIDSWRSMLRSDIEGAVASSEFWYDKPDADVAKPLRTSPTFEETLQITR